MKQKKPDLSHLVFSWTHSKEEVRSSTKHPGTYDQPKEAVTWLKNFRSLNSNYLSQVLNIELLPLIAVTFKHFYIVVSVSFKNQTALI